MKKIGDIVLGDLPRVVLAVREFEDGLATAYSAGVSILEIRADLFLGVDSALLQDELARYRSLKLPLILTIRMLSEGGEWTASETDRERLFLDGLAQVDAVDIELQALSIRNAVVDACKKAGKTLILSYHSLNETPSDQILEALVKEASGLGADIVKIACQPQKSEDVERLLALVKRNRNLGMVGISMGSLGAKSRLDAFSFGSLLTYTSREMNYGQIGLEELVRSLRQEYPDFNAEFMRTRKAGDLSQ